MSSFQLRSEEQAPPRHDPTDPVERLRLLRRRMEAVIGVPATDGNRLEVYRNGDEIFPAMLAAIDAAEHTVDFLTFVYWRGDIARRFAHALGRSARRGRRVRVLIDAFGGRLIEKDLLEHMEECGVQLEWFRPVLQVSPLKHNHRTHRKVLICDETVAFTGGVGIAEEWEGDARDENEWRDTHVRIVGPAVDGLAAAFSQDWAETGRPLVDERDRFPEHDASGPSAVQVLRGTAAFGWNDVSLAFRNLIESAQESICLTTAYFAPDPTMEALLCDAARERNVQVDVLVPGPYTDKRVSQLAYEEAYERLTACGVRIWNFQPTMLHAKVSTFDGLVAVVGSANFNNRSLRHDDEVVLVVFDPAVAAILDSHFEEDLLRSEPIDPARWAGRSRSQRALEKGASAIRYWL